jgi:hypothetical protein
LKSKEGIEGSPAGTYDLCHKCRAGGRLTFINKKFIEVSAALILNYYLIENQCDRSESEGANSLPA